MVEHYPAGILDGFPISDHYPVAVAISGALTERQLKLEGITDEAWVDRDERLAAILQEDFLLEACSTEMAEKKHIARLYQKLETAIDAVFKDLVSVAKPQRGEDTLRTFLQRRSHHRHIGIPRGALKTGNAPVVGRLVNEISRESWREYLDISERSDARPLIRYLAKAEGRPIWSQNLEEVQRKGIRRSASGRRLICWPHTFLRNFRRPRSRMLSLLMRCGKTSRVPPSGRS